MDAILAELIAQFPTFAGFILLAYVSDRNYRAMNERYDKLVSWLLDHMDLSDAEARTLKRETEKL